MGEVQASGPLGNAVRLVMFQFSFSNQKHIPLCLREKKEAAKHLILGEESIEGKSLLDSPVYNVSVWSCVSDFRALGYELVDAFFQKRKKDNYPFYIVRFVFVNRSYLNVSSEEFLQNQDRFLQALQKMCEEAAWRVRLFFNPFFENQKLVKDQFSISINLESRVPLVRGDGAPVMVWLEKDERGNPVKEKGKVPLRPDYCLRVSKEGFYFEHFKESS